MAVSASGRDRDRPTTGRHEPASSERAERSGDRFGRADEAGDLVLDNRTSKVATRCASIHEIAEQSSDRASASYAEPGAAAVSSSCRRPISRPMS
jgi:hypothetical protein